MEVAFYRNTHFEVKQLENIDKLNSVIGLIENTFELQKEREKDTLNLVTELNNLKRIFNDAEEEAIQKYYDARELIMTFKDFRAMDWPKMTGEMSAVADRARNKFEEVKKAVLKKEEEQNPCDLARVFQMMGITAFYANDISSAFKYLGESNRIYDAKARSEDNMPRAYTKHFLGVATKNWLKAGEATGGNVDVAYEHLLKANEILQGESGQFLVPVTLAEIISYRHGQMSEATFKVNEIIERFKKLETEKGLNSNQRSLFVRTLLLKGNIEMISNKVAEAIISYDGALGKDNNNPYAKLSLLQAKEKAQQPPDRHEWKNALALLESNGVTKKRETVTRVIALVWAVIAAHKFGDEATKKRYIEELESNKTALSLITDREPLFFSPISKGLEKFSTLNDQLNQYLES